MKILLIVDDEQEFRELLKETFEYRGFKCLTAENGEEALKLVKENRIALIILDLVMPKLDGIDTYKILKSDEKTKKIPVLVYSAQSPEVVAKKGFAASDVVDFLIKPFDTKDLIESVMQAVGSPEK